MQKITILLIGFLLIILCSETNKEESQTELFARIDREIKANSKAYSTLKEAT